MKPEKQIKRRDHQYQFTEKVACCKWFDRQSVKMLFSNSSGMQLTSTVQWRMKGSSTKIPVPCPDVIKTHNQGTGGVDLVYQKAAAYHLDSKFSIRFYLCIFFNLIDVACVNAFLVYNIMHQNDLTLLDYKTIISTCVIWWYTNHSRAPLEQKVGSKRKHWCHFEPNNLHCIPLNFNIAKGVVNAATKKYLTGKLS